MTIPVSVRDVVWEMEALVDESLAFLNKRTGELVSLMEEEMTAAEDEDEIDDTDRPDWERQMLEKTREVLNSDDYLELPSKFDIHEYSIMQKFCWSRSNQTIGEKLENAIRGSGTFRRFNDQIHDLGLADDWYQYRDQSLENIAIGWLEANEIPYTKETGTDE